MVSNPTLGSSNASTTKGVSTLKKQTLKKVEP